jgi:predicted ATPase
LSESFLVGLGSGFLILKFKGKKMAINTLIVENFKGIKERQEFEIRPITIFCGPNSSGKSSCIHALASLAQTVKLSASHQPIVLDDEYAQIHLGRFLDVIHSKKITDSFSLGVGLKTTKEYMLFADKGIKSGTQINTEITFKAKRAAQEIYIQEMKFEAGATKYKYVKSRKEYTAFKNQKQLDFSAVPVGKFKFRPNMEKINEPSNKQQKEVFEALIIGENISSNLTDELSNVYYLGPFRQGPLRRYATRGAQPTEVGASGEGAVAMLANEFLKSTSKHPNIARISSWIQELNLGKKIQLDAVSNTDLFDVSLTLEDGARLSVPDLGYGVSQVLPVLVQCSFSPKGATLLFEQPELHLHQGAARKLGGILCDIAKEKGLNIIAETHSPHLVYEVFQKVKSGSLNPSDVVLYDVCRRDGKSVFKKVEVELDGDEGIYIDHPWANNLDT